MRFEAACQTRVESAAKIVSHATCAAMLEAHCEERNHSDVDEERRRIDRRKG